MVIFPLFLSGTGFCFFFLWSSQCQSGRVPGGKTHLSIEGRPTTRPPEVFNFQTSSFFISRNSSKLLFKCSQQFLAPVVSASSKLILAVFTHLPRFQSGSLPCDFNSLMRIKKHCWLSVCSTYFMVWGWVWQLPSSLYIRAKTRSTPCWCFNVSAKGLPPSHGTEGQKVQGKQSQEEPNPL